MTMQSGNLRTLYLRWVGMNAVGEMLGLGATFAIAALIITWLGDGAGPLLVWAGYLVQVGTGVVEAALVGLAQWWAMHPWFPTITRRAWFTATLVGALLAYVLGFLPSTIMSLSAVSDPSAGPVTEPQQWIVLLLAAGLGLVAGAMLSFVQWRVLREHARGAGVWIPANMLAWMLGMPVVFWGIDIAQKGQPMWQSLLIMAGSLLVMGGVVGAVHGAFLVWLARKNRRY